jgi:hypothetical protein
MPAADQPEVKACLAQAHGLRGLASREGLDHIALIATVA